MDEAERCHEVAYIAFGKLLTRGTPDEVVSQTNLTVFELSGTNLHQIAKQVRSLQGVEQVTPFGQTMHVCGRNAESLERALRLAATNGVSYRLIPASLEDVFITLMNEAKDNYV
jgi:ABC-2 type transport system ATP-binding protein